VPFTNVYGFPILEEELDFDELVDDLDEEVELFELEVEDFELDVDALELDVEVLELDEEEVFEEDDALASVLFIFLNITS
jgi:hypothetical protein